MAFKAKNVYDSQHLVWGLEKREEFRVIWGGPLVEVTFLQDLEEE